MPGDAASQITELREAAIQARAFAETVSKKEQRRAFLELARKWEHEAARLERPASAAKKLS